jgi:formylglycine-generating enzyme required for sulfatase activity
MQTINIILCQLVAATLWVGVVVNPPLRAQNTTKTCPRYEEQMRKGEDNFAKNNYYEALRNYQAAAIAANECGINSSQPDLKIQRLVAEIEKQRTAAQQATKQANAEAEKARKAESAAKVAQEEARTQTEKARIEAQNALKEAENARKAKIQADEENKRAEKEKKRANLEAENATQANQSLKKIIQQVVVLQLQQADQAILNLSYDTALVQTNRIADLDELPDSTLKRYQEIAYWYTETKQTTNAINTLNQAAQHLKKPNYACPNPAQLSTHIQQLNLQHYQQLQKRYYPDMITITGGSYTMGSYLKELGREDDETQHTTTLSDFKIACTETTVFQFALYCQATYTTDSIDIRDFLKDATEKNDARHPVVSVSWYDAVAYANWLSQQQKYKVLYAKKTNGETARLDITAQGGYRLPTEAEWEYACRAGTTMPFNIDNNLSTDQANYNGNYAYANFPKGQNRGRTTPVATFLPNAWGLYDMHGNALEWCHDWYSYYLSNPPSNYFGPICGSNRVVRGGSWTNRARHCRSARRDYNAANYRGNTYGFRLVFFPQF